MVGHRALGRRTGHRLHGQGHCQRRAPGRHHRAQERHDLAGRRPRQHLRRQSAGLRRRAGDHWTCWKKGDCRTRPYRAAYMMEALRAMAARHACIGDVRGRGLMIGVEFVDGSREPHDRPSHCATASCSWPSNMACCIMGCGVNTMRIIPPLVVTRAEVDEGLAIFEHVHHVGGRRIERGSRG